MKSRWFSHVYLHLLAIGFFLIPAAWVQAQSVEQILKQKPSQSDVTIDIPAPEDVAKCKIGAFAEGGYDGKVLYGPDGSTPLRVICRQTGSKDKNNNRVEEIRFFHNGVEVFRENLITGESRWLGDAGSRIGQRSSKGMTWLSISPEETSAEVVKALATGDLARYKAVALTVDEIKSLGLTGAVADELIKQAESVDSGFVSFASGLNLPANVTWGAFNGNHPGLMPKGKSGLNVDLPIYFNAGVVLMDTADGGSRSHQITISDMVKIGNVWKVVGLPVGEAFGSDSGQVTVSSVFFPAMGGEGGRGISEQEEDYSQWTDRLQQALGELEQASRDQVASKCEEVFKLYMEIASKLPQERDNFIRESANFLMGQIRDGNYPGGVEKLEGLYEILKKEGDNRELTAFIRLRQIGGEYYAILADPDRRDGDKMNAGDEYKENLVAFADEFPRTQAAAEALMTLALDQEYIQENDGALNYYSTVARDFPNEPIGQKASGAVARLSSIGKTFPLPADWKFSDGSAIGSLATGKTTVLFCWASWSYNPEDFDLMKKIASRGDVNVIGISLDQDAGDANEILKRIGSMPWKNVFVPGNAPDVTNSPTALALGMQAAPMMIVVDGQGQTLLPNVMSVADLEVRLDGIADAR
ncbi:MAG: thioredoxin family protein [Thermoguttaceae bacterium]|nr:thioredoxin family protein [Thermoguttaceae bacterium]